MTISDDGNTLAFISTRDLVPAVGNLDKNPELFFCRTTNGFAAGSNTFAQGTNTQDLVISPRTFTRVTANPSLSFNGNIVAFVSTADLAGSNNDVNGHGNAEVYAADFTGSGLTNIRQITKTKEETSGPNVGVTLNLFSPGRRLSRDGKFVAYDTRAENPAANDGTNAAFIAPFVSDVPAAAATNPTPKRVGPRATVFPGDVDNFPTFTDYDSSLSPRTLVYASNLNIKADGTLLTNQDATGLNPAPANFLPANQIFSTQLPVTSTNTFTRLTKNPVLFTVAGLRPLSSATRARITFNLQGTELGGGNGVGDFSSEVFYLLTPAVPATETTGDLKFFTFPTIRGPMSSADPGPTPSPTPTPSPSPGEPAGLAPGEWSIVKASAPLANSDKPSGGGPENTRSPILPIELNGVSVSVNGYAAGLYFVGASPDDGIHLVMPIGAATGVATVVVNNRGTAVFRGWVQIVPSQPDIIAIPRSAAGGGTAYACNITKAVSNCVMGPFKVTSGDNTGAQVPTVLELHLSGTRLALASETKVSFISGTTTIDITPTSVRNNPFMFGEDLIVFTLPASLAGAAPIDYKVIVTVTKSGTFTSRPVATAPQITIIP
jgi:uncharacterized protein (TIGR03437 family)